MACIEPSKLFGELAGDRDVGQVKFVDPISETSVGALCEYNTCTREIKFSPCPAQLDDSQQQTVHAAGVDNHL